MTLKIKNKSIYFFLSKVTQLLLLISKAKGNFFKTANRKTIYCGLLNCQWVKHKYNDDDDDDDDDDDNNNNYHNISWICLMFNTFIGWEFPKLNKRVYVGII